MKKNKFILALLLLLCNNMLYAQQPCSNKMVVASGGIANNRLMLTVGESIVSNQFTSLQLGYQSMFSYSCRTTDVSEVQANNLLIRYSIADNGSTLYPNPAGNQITIGNINNDSHYHYFIFDYTGKLIMENNLPVPNSQVAVDISKLCEAIYMFQLVDLSNGNSQTFKFSKTY
jgi:hypothetical protein